MAQKLLAGAALGQPHTRNPLGSHHCSAHTIQPGLQEASCLHLSSRAILSENKSRAVFVAMEIPCVLFGRLYLSTSQPCSLQGPETHCFVPFPTQRLHFVPFIWLCSLPKSQRVCSAMSLPGWSSATGCIEMPSSGTYKHPWEA